MNRSAARAGQLLWLSILLLLAPACAERAPRADRAPARSASTAATPPYYRIEGHRGADLLLLGTVHFGPAKGWDLSPALDAGIARADRFLFEIDLRAATGERVGDLLAELAVLGPGQRLPALVSPETARMLEQRDAQLTSLGFPRGARDGREPWYIAVSLVELPVEANGWSLADSVEQQVFRAIRDRPLAGLETVEAQLRMLDGLPYPLQDLMLRDTLAHLDDSAATLEQLATAWRTGDLDRLSAIAREGVGELPGLEAVYEALLDERNRRWVAQLRPLLDDPAFSDETVFVAVGALHLVGEAGLVALLEEAGYDAASIDQKRGASAQEDSSSK